MRDTKVNITEIVKSLKGNPVFNMSLSSKELFHSNVLAWLLESKNESGSTKYAEALTKRFKPIVPNFEDYSILTVLREKNNFDLLIIYYNTKKEKQDLEYVVVENKFKAIPDEKQLNRYTEEIFGIQRYAKNSNKGKKDKIKIKEYKRKKNDFEKKHIFVTEEIQDCVNDTNEKYIPKKEKYELEAEHTTCYLLAPKKAAEAFLSRVKSEKSYISRLKDSEISMLKEKGITEKIEKEWKIVTYDEICTDLKNEYQAAKKNDEIKISESELYIHKFIDYYTEFVRQILSLSEIIFNNTTDVFPNKDDIKKLKKIRIHDYYEKQWYSNVLNQILKELKKIDACDIKKTTVEYSNCQGMLNFYYTLEEDEEKNYGIQIQNQQFRFFCFPVEDNITSEIYGKLSMMKEKWIKNLENEDLLKDFPINTKNTENPEKKFGTFKYVYQKLPDNCTIKQLSYFLKVAKQVIEENI